MAVTYYRTPSLSVINDCQRTREHIFIGSEATRKHLAAFFGDALPDSKLASLVGALNGSVTEITPLGSGFLSRARHRYLVEQTRSGGSGEAGLFLTNEFFQLTGDAPRCGNSFPSIKYIDQLAKSCSIKVNNFSDVTKSG